MENRVGQQFGKYRLIERRGSGANGVVYKGQNVHDPDGSPVAVKVLETLLKDTDATKKFDDAKKFIEEVGAICRLEHPNIIKLLDFGIEKNDHPFLVMNYAVGSLPKRRQLAPSLIVNYVKQIAAALQHAHNNRMVHRDIKPDNILLGPKGEVWVSDFGIAIIAHGSKSWVQQQAAGTPGYMAPEQFLGSAEPASDQYSLGMLVYEWLCGKHPSHVREKIPTISPQAEQVVLKALAKDPQQRFPSIQAFSDALEQALLPSRKIALFGYETDGGRNSALWNNPQVFFSDPQYTIGYAAWSKTKRSFTREEILDGIWVKASDNGNHYKVRFLRDGGFIESRMFDPNEHWKGSWQVLDEVLRMNVNNHELDIFANSEGTKHSGIEFYNDEKTPHAYFTILHVLGLNAKQWDDMHEIINLVHRLYGQVLHRRADEIGLITYGAQLHRGEKSVREIVKILACSPEYREQFIDPLINANMIEAAVELCFERLLGRNADDLGRSEYAKVMQTQGLDVVIKALIDSDEYKKSFGEDDLPLNRSGSQER